jgi:hypothetical protein
MPDHYSVLIRFDTRHIDPEWILNKKKPLTIAIDGAEWVANIIQEENGRFSLRTERAFSSEEEAGAFAEKLERGLKALSLSSGISGALRIRTVEVIHCGRPNAPTDLRLSPFGGRIESFGKLLNAACAECVDDSKFHAAIDSFNGSFFEELWRFAVMRLIVALELLAGRQKRSEESLALIQTLLAVVDASGLGDAEKRKLANGLDGFRNESISMSIIAYLPRVGLSGSEALIKEAYSIRSGVAHGDGDKDDLDNRVVGLKMINSLRRLTRAALEREKQNRIARAPASKSGECQKVTKSDK